MANPLVLVRFAQQENGETLAKPLILGVPYQTSLNDSGFVTLDDEIPQKLFVITPRTSQDMPGPFIQSEKNMGIFGDILPVIALNSYGYGMK